MKTSTTAIYTCWGGMIVSSLVQGIVMPAIELLRHPLLPWPVFVFLPFFVIINAFIDRPTPTASFLQRYFEAKFDRDTYRDFIARLKPDLMFATMGLIMGIVAGARTAQLGGSFENFLLPIFFFNAGIAFLIMNWIRRKYRKN